MSYNAIGVYNDRADRRLIVPKRDPRFGWTLNLAHPAAAPLLVALGVAIGVVVAGGLIAG